MKNLVPFLLLFILRNGHAQTLPQPLQLPNGWKISPVGKSFDLGDLPLNIAVSKSNKYLAVTNNGQSTQSIQLIDVKSERILDQVEIEKSWYGITFTSDEKFIYVSGGHDNRIVKYEIINQQLKRIDSISLDRPWPVRVGPAGIALDESNNMMYVVTREDKMLYAVDMRTKQVVNKYGLDAEAYDCKFSSKTNELYITCWGCDKVLVFDTKNRQWKQPIGVGDNPNEMLLTNDAKYLYVCNANDNSVSIIDLSKKAVIETLDAALYPNSPSGSTTNSIALDPVGKKLYIANADNNCLATFDVSVPGNSKPKGFIPVGWYPTSVRFINGKIWVANGKGMTSKANPFGPSPLRKKEDVIHHGFEVKDGSQVEYIGGLFKGSMSIIEVPNQLLLDQYTRRVYENAPYSPQKTVNAGIADEGNPIPMKLGDKSPIKYVFYVIKENRTYDQVLGDVEKGNGDTSLVLFGRKYTPNQHALVDKFVLLDNFYVDAEVSADGHNWSMGALANDYLEKTWPTSYGGRGGTYGGEGEREIANNKAGFIWNNCNRYGVSFRTYGEFMSGNKPTISVLNNHFCAGYPEYNLNIADTTRFRIWKKDFDSLLAIGKLPQFNTVRFGNDHTEGVRLGRPTPYAHVADNDLAVGMFVEALSKSAIWNETAVFILEDDAQNGADHVDAHRSTAYVAGGFVKRGFVDHTPYTTSSMLRTMELILGMGPMTQYDAAATPMWRCFDKVARPFDFKAIVPDVDMNQRNTAINEWQKKSEKFNFAKEDANNDIEFNKVLWHGIKGNIPFPGPKRAAFLKLNEGDEDDD
ncbi:MAG: bifunctional YncE family protein/alkaline phosphatase family protein [Chitinophagaceae bacterium]|jgi:YVTN family beta-propeller protein